MISETSEWDYRYHERLGLLIDGTRAPTKLEEEIAREEAFKAVEQLQSNSSEHTSQT